jgi:hypothetical protein
MVPLQVAKKVYDTQLLLLAGIPIDNSKIQEFLHPYYVLMHGLLNRWTSQLDLGSTTGGLERVVSVHNFGAP